RLAAELNQKPTAATVEIRDPLNAAVELGDRRDRGQALQRTKGALAIVALVEECASLLRQDAWHPFTVEIEELIALAVNTDRQVRKTLLIDIMNLRLDLWL